MKSSREVALKILNEVTNEGAFSNISISRNMSKEISSKDESLIREIVYGVLENKLLLDWMIKKFSNTRFNKINPIIKNILRMGIYQIVYMDKIPDRAAVFESVKLAKKYSHRGLHGFVNGVLRNISRKKDNINLSQESMNFDEYLSIKYSHPKWMVQQWIKEYGKEFTEGLCKANNERPKLNIRVNTLKTTRKELVEILYSKGFMAKECKIAHDGIIVENPVRITEIDEYKKGYFQIQDESSMLVGQIMNPKEGSIVVDVTSAPGGKATHIAEKMKNRGKIIARDIYRHKIKLINDNAQRLGIDIISTQEFDALDIDESLVGKADYCLVDAPCSGLGLIRRKPDIKWHKDQEEVENITDLQYNILQNASKYLKDEGILVYSTCTIEKRENIELIKEFLKNNSQFSLLGFEDLLPSNKQLSSARNGYIELFPNIHNTDGFFIAKLIKNNMI